MRTWVIITLMAFMGTVLSTDSHCVEAIESQHSSIHSHSAESFSHVNESVSIEKVSQSQDSRSSTDMPAHNDSLCNHVHCCGVILGHYKVTFKVSLVAKHLLLNSSRLLSVDLELPIKPPAV